MSGRLRKLHRRLRYGKPIVVVSGLPRSGTSMAMNMLHAGGVPIVTDGIRTADEDNPKGYYEDERVKHLGENDDKSWLKSSRGKAIKIIAFLLTDLPGNNNYKIVFMNRDLREILESQAKMLARRGETREAKDERMLELYERHLDRVKFLLRYRPHFESLDVRYTDVLRDPRTQSDRMRNFLGRPLDIERMVEVVDERLYRNRS